MRKMKLLSATSQFIAKDLKAENHRASTFYGCPDATHDMYALRTFEKSTAYTPEKKMMHHITSAAIFSAPEIFMDHPLKGHLGCSKKQLPKI
jgi:hypothetical protein